MCRSRLWLLYWVSTQILLTPALTRFDSAKSISRYRPPKGTAGLARSSVSGARRLPAPPASTMLRTRSSAISTSWRMRPSGAVLRAPAYCSGGQGHADLRLSMPGSFPVRHQGSIKAVLCCERDQGLGPVVEVLVHHVVLGAVGAVEGEVEEAARRHDPAHMRQALIDHLDRGVREHAVRVHEVERAVRQESQAQVLDEGQPR